MLFVYVSDAKEDNQNDESTNWPAIDAIVVREGVVGKMEEWSRAPGRRLGRPRKTLRAP